MTAFQENTKLDVNHLSLSFYDCNNISHPPVLCQWKSIKGSSSWQWSPSSNCFKESNTKREMIHPNIKGRSALQSLFASHRFSQYLSQWDKIMSCVDLWSTFRNLPITRQVPKVVSLHLPWGSYGAGAGYILFKKASNCPIALPSKFVRKWLTSRWKTGNHIVRTESRWPFAPTKLCLTEHQFPVR